MKVKYSRSRHNAKQTSFTSPTGARRQCGEQEHAQYCTNHDVTSGWSCRRPENVSILSSLVRRRRLRKHHLKVMNSRYFIALIPTVKFVKCWLIFLSCNWILKDCIKVQEKKKESRCLVFTSSTKREIKYFHVVVVQRRQRNVQKSVMHVQSCSLLI